MQESGFVEDLLREITFLRDSNQDQLLPGENTTEFPPEVIIHWLNFAVYYERASARFIGGWLKTTSEDDALHYFAQQVEDECNHYRWFKTYLSEYVADVDKFSPPDEWKFLMEDYYPNLNTLVERLSAHNLAAETGALGFMEYGFNRFPPHMKNTIEKVMKDERYHVEFGKKLLNKYCITEEQRQQARRAALQSVEYMARAREVFVNI